MKLVKVTEENKYLLDTYEISEKQLMFTSTPADALKQKETGRHNIMAIVDGKAVCFFVLHEGDGPKIYIDREHLILLRALSTDHRYEGRGYGTNVLTLLPDFIREYFPAITTIILAVNVQNERAKSIYDKIGYVDYGLRIDGSIGELIIMEKSL